MILCLAFRRKYARLNIDVDLAESTKDCLKYIYPKIVSGGFLMPQDGGFPLVIEIFESEDFWKNEVGSVKPKIQGLGTNKMITIIKPRS